MTELIETTNRGTFTPLPIGAVDWIRKAWHFVSQDKNALRQQIKRVCIDWMGVTATDGRCLVHFPFGDEWLKGVHFQQRLSLGENNLVKRDKNEQLYINRDGTCSLLVSKNPSNGWNILSAQLQNGYPAWERVCPHDYNERIDIGDDARKTLVKAMAGVSSKDNVTIAFKKRVLTFTWNNEIGTEHRQILQIEATDYHDFVHWNRKELSFSVYFLLPILRSLKHTVIEYNDEFTPVKFSGGDGWAILMPMRH